MLKKHLLGVSNDTSYIKTCISKNVFVLPEITNNNFKPIGKVMICDIDIVKQIVLMLQQADSLIEYGKFPNIKLVLKYAIQESHNQYDEYLTKLKSKYVYIVNNITIYNAYIAASRFSKFVQRKHGGLAIHELFIYVTT